MLKADGKLVFGEFLPDLPFYENPGLVEAKNCIPVDKHYKDFLPLTTVGDALADTPLGAFAAIDSDGDPEIYVGIDSAIYQRESTSWTSRSAATMGAVDYWRFTQFDDEVIATDGVDEILSRTLGSGSNFAALATSGDSPIAKHVGVIGRFVVAGDLDSSSGGRSAVQWSAFDNPHDWPTPGGASANAVQAGRQILNLNQGYVTGISQGEFWGLVFQQRAITRFTYEGGDTVFQIQTYDYEHGCWAPQSLIQIAGITYCYSTGGFIATDGQSINHIGARKVDKWFQAQFDQTYKERMTVAADYLNKCIFWSFASVSATSGLPDRVVMYNYDEARWAWGEEAMHLLFNSFTTGYTLDQLDSINTSIDAIGLTLDSSYWQGGIPTMMAVDSDLKLGTFGGTPAIATFETGEIDVNPFGRAMLRGIRPLVTGEPTGLTIAVSTRDAQDNEGRSWGDATSRTTRTGVCDFRESGRFISVQEKITGGFDRAIGIGFDLVPDGQV
jgi:hypothetical protein